MVPLRPRRRLALAVPVALSPTASRGLLPAVASAAPRVVRASSVAQTPNHVGGVADATRAGGPRDHGFSGAGLVDAPMAVTT